jgi:hypothetical protein
MAQIVAILIHEDWTPPTGPSTMTHWPVKRGDIGWARGPANQYGYVQAQIFDSDKNSKVVAGISSCCIPERVITRGAPQVLSNKIQTTPLNISQIVPAIPVSDPPLGRAIEALLKRICGEHARGVLKGVNSFEIDEIKKDVMGFKNRIIGGIYLSEPLRS